jgi:hypothetical protein
LKAGISKHEVRSTNETTSQFNSEKLKNQMSTASPIPSSRKQRYADMLNEATTPPSKVKSLNKFSEIEHTLSGGKALREN